MLEDYCTTTWFVVYAVLNVTSCGGDCGGVKCTSLLRNNGKILLLSSKK